MKNSKPKEKPRHKGLWPEPWRCNSRLRLKPGYFCGRKKERGKTRCGRHGAKSLSGPDHPNYIDGSTSRRFPANLMKRFEVALDDPKLFDLRRDVAALEVLIGEEMTRMMAATGGTFDDWATGDEKFTSLEEAIRNGDQTGMATALSSLRTLFKSVREIIRATRHFMELTDQRRKLVESQSRNQARFAETMTDLEVGLFFNALATAIRKRVTDGPTLRGIETEFAQLVSRTPIKERTVE